jgi:hypothetical protein
MSWYWCDLDVTAGLPLGNWRVSMRHEGVEISSSTFTIATAPADTFEPNDSFAGATVLSSGSQALSNLSIHAADNDDYFRWTAPASGTLTVTATFDHDDGDVDLFLYDAAQGELDSSDGTDNSETVSASVVAGQAYYIRVVGYGGAINPDYDLSITGPTFVPPEITVLGSGVSIIDGDGTPSLADHTDFGTATQGQTMLSRIFTVRNDGPGVLTLGAPSLPAGFSLVEGLVASLASGASDTFTVGLATAVGGTFAGDISFVTNDADENPFNFSIVGVVTGPPEILVLGSEIEIPFGDTTPTIADGTDFGEVAAGGSRTHAFTIQNHGAGPLQSAGPVGDEPLAWRARDV